MTAQVSPTFSYLGFAEKEWNLNLDEGWKLQAGSRRMQYSSALQTRVGFVKVERHWESFRTSYSYQLERSSGVSVAPSHVLQLDYLYSPRDSIGVSLTNGREIADFGPLGILNTEVRNVAVRGQHCLPGLCAHFQPDSQPWPPHCAKGVRIGLRHSGLTRNGCASQAIFVAYEQTRISSRPSVVPSPR